MNLDNLGLVILNYNSGQLTENCVDCLLAMNSNFHIIVVDNLSTDNSLDYLNEKFCNNSFVSVISSGENNGYSAGNNFGIKYAIREYQIDYFGILNPDVIIPDIKVIEKMVNTLSSREECAIVGASVLDKNGLYNPSNSAWSIPSKRRLVLKNLSFIATKIPDRISWRYIDECMVQVDCVAGCFFIGSIQKLQAIGFLDESIFMYNEEILLGSKIKSHEWKEYCLLDSFYYHLHGTGFQKKSTPKELIRRRKRRFKSDVIIFEKIYPGSRGLLFLYAVEYFNRLFLFPWFYIRNLFRPEG